MIVLDCEQGDPTWIELRCGIPTSSRFKEIVTPAGRPSASRTRYLARLLAEWALGPAEDFGGTAAMERGLALEPQARRYLAFAADLDVRRVGLIFRDSDRMVAASPDGMADGVPVEIKCPEAHTHLMWLSAGGVPREHHLQTQGHLWVTGSRRGWFLSFHPGLPALLVETDPDTRIQDALDETMPGFVADMLDRRARLKELGVDPVAEWAVE